MTPGELHFSLVATRHARDVADELGPYLLLAQLLAKSTPAARHPGLVRLAFDLAELVRLERKARESRR